MRIPAGTKQGVSSRRNRLETPCLRDRRSRSLLGFSLIEMTICIALAAAVFGTAFAVYGQLGSEKSKEAKWTAAYSDFEQIARAIQCAREFDGATVTLSTSNRRVNDVSFIVQAASRPLVNKYLSRPLSAMPNEYWWTYNSGSRLFYLYYSEKTSSSGTSPMDSPEEYRYHMPANPARPEGY